MAFSINEIRSQLVYGGFKPTNFQVRIFNPANPVADIKTQFMVQATQAPSSTMGTMSVPYFGRQIKMAGDRVFDSWSVVVINDEDFLIRNALEQWSNEINGHISNLRGFGGPQPSLYKSNAHVVMFSKTGESIREYEVEGIWPSEISPMDLDWSAADTLSTFQVTFSMDSWRIIGGNTGNAGID